jgi:hypothetical protein
LRENYYVFGIVKDVDIYNYRYLHTRIMEKKPTDLVLINVRVTREFREDLGIASKKLRKPVSHIAVEAFEQAIDKALKL